MDFFFFGFLATIGFIICMFLIFEFLIGGDR